MRYKVDIISKKKKDELVPSLYEKCTYEVKAEIYGLCVKLFTNSRVFREMWEDNFKAMMEYIRPHCRLIAVNDGGKFKVMYEPSSKTVIIKNCDYYGWIKSIGLGLAADFIEDFPSEHKRHSIHGSYVDRNGRGVGVIGPSKSGKTTLTYGLLLDKTNNFVTDDWCFVRVGENSVHVTSAEKNSYIGEDLTENWKQYKNRIKGIDIDNKGRAIVDVKRLFGYDRIREKSIMTSVVILTRNKNLPPFQSLSTKDALDFMREYDFCNPHQLVRTKEKMDSRTRFFKKLFESVDVYLLNTIETPRESLERLKTILYKN